jgi:hypothetical protein
MVARSRKRRGRPPGSVKLTPELQRIIVAFVEAGAFDYVAAEAAGIDERTFRDWIARGEGRHPTRGKTPQLASLASAVREARAKARASREIIVADRDPKFWLQHAARSKPGREGWSEPIDAVADAAESSAYAPDQQELAEIVAVLTEAGVLALPSCSDPNCGCSHHGGNDENG